MARYSVPSSRSQWKPRFRAHDVLSALSAPWIAIALRDDSLIGKDGTGTTMYAAVAFAATLVAIAYYRIGSHLFDCFAVEDAIETAKTAMMACLFTAAIEFSLARLDGIPRSVPAIHFLVLASFLIAGRALYATRFGDRDSKKERSVAGLTRREKLVLIGADRAASLYVRSLAQLTADRPEIAAVLDLDGARVGKRLAGHTILGDCSILPDLLDEMAVHGVGINRFVVVAAAAAPGTAYWRDLCAISQARGIAIEFLSLQISRSAPYGPTPELGRIVGARGAERRGYHAAKRLIDIVLSACAILLLLPLFATVALLVVFSIGFPMLFWQERIGRHGHRIHVHKFRSLRTPIDKAGRRRTDSERHTHVGQIIRALHLDELPQLFDVLRGEMSLVGPRPLLLVDQPKDAALRLTVRPGLTGWAQIRGGKTIAAEEKNLLDVWYVDHSSLALDLKIMLLTVKTIFMGHDRDGLTEGMRSAHT